ncbi:MAG: ATP-binding protein [Chromatiales bacterium]|nr:ATP-binding protein [Chromatiales bacterium]
MISLTFAREGNHILIHRDDDGAGLDLPRIRAAAIERGLVAADAGLGDPELARLILLPGFSTRTSVSEVSGRGVGMDVVHTALQKLKGTIDIHSDPDRGCRFTLRLPMTLGSAHCLVVRTAGQVAAIPDRHPRSRRLPGREAHRKAGRAAHLSRGTREPGYPRPRRAARPHRRASAR